MSILTNRNRLGRFTSSEIVALVKGAKRQMTEAELAARPKKGVGSSTTIIEDPNELGEKALTYIEEKNMEIRLDISLDTESNARPLVWGLLCESVAFNHMELDYILSSDVTDIHPTIPYWAGSKDAIKHDKGRTVCDFKAPITRKSFCVLVAALYAGLIGMEAMNYIRENHPDGEKYYWQLLSNAIINDCKYAELIIYMPYYSELEAIRAAAANVPEEKRHAHSWIVYAADEELPYLKDGGYYKNINIIRFAVPQEDKEFLTSKVLKAGKLLINTEAIPFTMLAENIKDTAAILVSGPDDLVL